MRFRRMRRTSIPVVLTLIALALGSGSIGAQDRAGAEVWATDQASTEADPSGFLYIWDAADLSANARTATPFVIDLAAAADEAADVLAAAGCAATGIRPHMLLKTSDNSHVILAHTASDSLYIMDVESRRISGCVPVDAHYAGPSPNGRTIIAGDIGEQLLTKVASHYDRERYRVVDTLDFGVDTLGGETIDSLIGSAGAGPVCGEYTADSRFHIVTTNRGGLVVVDVRRFEVVQVIDNSKVQGIGCGTHLQGDKMLITGESGASPDNTFDGLYVLDVSGRPPYPDPVEIELPGKDVHGLVVCTDRQGDERAVLTMRVSNDVNFVDLGTNTVADTRSMARRFSPDPKPDVADRVGNDVFVALRGGAPTTAITGLQDADRTPGVAVLHLSRNCDRFRFGAKDIAPMLNPSNVELTSGPDAGELVNASDPHGLEVVPRP